MPKSKKPLTDSQRSLETSFASLKAAIPGLGESYLPVPPEDILRFPSIQLNLALGKDRGIRKGSMVMWYGPMSTFKTGVALMVCRAAQQQWPEKPVAFIDVEYRVDVRTAVDLYGVNDGLLKDMEIPAFVYRKPRTGEEAWTEAIQLCRSGVFSVVVIDSLKGMVPGAQLQNEDPAKILGVVGAQARLNSNALPLANAACAMSGTILWMTNQERILSMQPVVTKGACGGGAPLYWTTHIISVDYMPKPGNEDSPGTVLKLHVEKNKFGRPEIKLEVPVIYGHGIDEEGDLVEVAVREGLLTKSGSWYYHGDTKLGQGREAASQYLRDNSKAADQIREELYSKDATNV